MILLDQPPLPSLPPCPPHPDGECEICGRPFEYEPNPNWGSIKHLFKVFPERGYWLLKGHTACDSQSADNEKNEKLRLARLQSEQQLKRELRDLGFARVIDEMPFESFTVDAGNRAAHDAMIRWQHPERGVLLHGLPGRGKSHLMAAQSKRWQGAGLTVAFQTMSGLLALLRRGYDEDQFDERLRFVSSRADILMLDDLGAEQAKEWGEEKLYMIIDTRMNSKLPLFVTTNLAEKELEKRYHPRIASRLREMCTWVGLEGPDWRTVKR